MEKVRQILIDAMKVDADAREAFVRSACGDDVALAEEVLAYLAAENQDNPVNTMGLQSALGHEMQEVLVSLTGSESTEIGPYRVLKLVGEGGMGSVFRAEQTEPIQREVALKIIKAGMDTRQALARFESERQTLASMSHPSIAAVYDAGAAKNGRPYFAMEFVDGIHITEHCEEFRLSARERVQLVIELCYGVEHAHQKGVIHRDLKPTNVLVTQTNKTSIPKIIDFGIAKVIASTQDPATMFTMQGQMLGTPEYMSPEQATPGELVDTRTDIYALGILLYELLTGTNPWRQEGSGPRTSSNVLELIRESDPARPSRQAAASPGRHRELKGDLDWIVMKAIEKEPNRRYQSVRGLADDLQRYLDDEPVSASPPTRRYLLSKYVRRHKAGVIAASLVALALILGVVGTSIGLVRARAAQQAEARRALHAERVSGFLKSIFEAADPDVAGGQEPTASELLQTGAQSIRTGLADEPEVQAELMSTIGDVFEQLGSFTEAESLHTQAARIRTELFGPRDSRTLISRSQVAQALLRAERSDEAKSVWEDVHADWVAIDQADHLDAVNTRLGLANANRNLTLEAVSESLFVDVIQTWEADPEQHWSRLANAKTDYAVLLNATDRRQDARVQYEEAVALHEQHGAGPTLAKMIALGNLAIFVERQDGEVEAEPIKRRVLEMAELLLSPDHQEVGRRMVSLAINLENQGRLEEAKDLYDQGIAIRENALGSDHINVGRDLHNFAGLLTDMGNFEGAEAAYLRSGKIMRQQLGDRHRNVGFHLNVLGSLYMRMNRLPEAEAALNEALDLRVESYGEKHSRVASVLAQLARLRKEQGNETASRELYERCIDMAVEVLGPTQRRTVAYVMVYAEALEEWGHAEEAAELRERMGVEPEPSQ